MRDYVGEWMNTVHANAAARILRRSLARRSNRFRREFAFYAMASLAGLKPAFCPGCGPNTKKDERWALGMARRLRRCGLFVAGRYSNYFGVGDAPRELAAFDQNSRSKTESYNEAVDYIRKVGRWYGYPSCCIAASIRDGLTCGVNQDANMPVAVEWGMCKPSCAKSWKWARAMKELLVENRLWWEGYAPRA